MKTSIEEPLLAWFRQTKRDLPWRRTYDPYHVWISEIMLQQTQMDRGVEYFRRWIARFPDVTAVAEAEEQEILKLWEGLGYYARARNLHRAAKVMKERHAGSIPCDYQTLRALPGIGPYTAAAIASIACNQNVPVIDANVARIFARLFDLDEPNKGSHFRKKLEQHALDLLPEGKARIFNQALMDLGGLICTPKNPSCEQCPLAHACLALLRGVVADRPVTGSRQKTIVIEMATGILAHAGRLFIQQRLADDIWGGLWEFPGGRLEKGETPEQAVVREYEEETGFAVKVCGHITTVIHHYTRYKVVLHCFACGAEGDVNSPKCEAAQQNRWVLPTELAAYAFPAGHRKLLEHMRQYCPDRLVDPCCRSGSACKNEDQSVSGSGN
ncbi:MAG: A/G-specific adenine glycosylase [Desulfobulbaceae bacterium]|nr:MAG: A/G-specific adenine glycosylase [Desulfobulbaceae bacterium]